MLLQKYEDRAKKMTIGELLYAVRDVTETMALHPANPDGTFSEYLNKLYAEFDAYTVEISRRRK